SAASGGRALLKDALLDVSDRDKIVLEPFAGSGSTLIAAEATSRVRLRPDDDVDEIEPRLPGEQTRLLLTDEPYNVPNVGHVTSQAHHREFAMAAGEMRRILRLSPLGAGTTALRGYPSIEKEEATVILITRNTRVPRPWARADVVWGWTVNESSAVSVCEPGVVNG